MIKKILLIFVIQAISYYIARFFFDGESFNDGYYTGVIVSSVAFALWYYFVIYRKTQ